MTKKAAKTARKTTKTARKAGSTRKPATGKSRSAGKATARKQRGAPSAPAGAKVIRPGSKLETIVGLLTRPEGCTGAEVKAACEWPAVSMPQQAEAAGLILTKEKVDGVTRYRGAYPKAA